MKSPKKQLTTIANVLGNTTEILCGMSFERIINRSFGVLFALIALGALFGAITGAYHQFALFVLCTLVSIMLLAQKERR